MIDGKEKWCFRNKETGQRICAATKEKAAAAMRARYAHESQHMDLTNPINNDFIPNEEVDFYGDDNNE